MGACVSRKKGIVPAALTAKQPMKADLKPRLINSEITEPETETELQQCKLVDLSNLPALTRRPSEQVPSAAKETKGTSESTDTIPANLPLKAEVNPYTKQYLQ